MLRGSRLFLPSTPFLSRPMTFPSWMEPRSITHPINGTEVEFYEVSITKFASLRKPLTTLSQSLGTLLLRVFDSDSVSGTQQTDDTYEDGSIKRTKGRLTPPTESIIHMDEQRDLAISRAADALLDPSNQLAMGRFVLDSLRLPTTDAGEFINHAGAPAVKEMLTGALKANAGVFGPFASKLLDRVKTATPGVTSDSALDSSSPADGLTPTLVN